MNLQFKIVDYKATLQAVKRWHYSCSLPVGKLFSVGVFEDNKFIGVVIFSRGANPFLLKQYNLQQDEGCELARVALNKHKTPVTKIIKVSISLLKKYNPGLKLIVSFADMNQGHIGKIYQAGNWIYTGIAKSSPEYYIGNRWVHSRQAGSLGYSLKNIKFPKRLSKNKFRYLMPLTKKMRKDILHLSKEYPKKII